MKNTLIALAIAISALPVFGTAPAEAGRCKQPLPFGGWTWVPCTAPAPRVNKRTAGQPTCYFKIRNVDKTDTISYQVFGSNYRLAPGYWRKHKGTCSKKTVKFDRVAGNGRYDHYTETFDPEHYDIKVWRKGIYIRTRQVPD